MEKSRGVVTASSAAAAKVGADIMRAGGNAVDAAVATAFASCVADPCNTGLGGYGGHMIVAPPDGQPICIDFNTWMDADLARPSAPPQRFGVASTAMPSVVAGLAAAMSRYGSLTWADVVEPARLLAEQGVESNETTHAAFSEVADEAFLSECFVFDAGAKGAARFSRFRQPALADTLAKLSSEGPGWFYEGPVGDQACRIFQGAGHTISRADWRDASQAVIVEPASRWDVAGRSFFSAPLGTSGSASLFATIAAGRAAGTAHGFDSVPASVAWAEALASIWTYRFGTPGGNDLDDVPMDRWIDLALAHRAIGPIPPSAGHTCHLNVAAADGTLVAMTLTHGPSWFGARWAVPGTGVIMNGGMHVLAAAQPRKKGKRAYAVTNMAPTIARHGPMSIAIGCPGARKIPSNIGLALTHHMFGSANLQDSIAKGRFHAESLDRVSLEKDRNPALLGEALAGAFKVVEDEDPHLYYGPLTAIARAQDGALSVGLDDRKMAGFAAWA